MADTTDVFLITGFLGSGKTTFLNRIIADFPQDKKMTILMNEFGEVGIDGTLVEGEEIDMLEISRGSIFCVCVKTDFIKGLYELNTKVQPDVLIIESTGVANPTDLKRDIKLPIFADRFQFREQFCIVDAEHFLEAFEIFASVEKQLSSSTVFIINKTDLVQRSTIDAIRQKIGQYHPQPVFFETTHARIPVQRFFFGQDTNDSVDPAVNDNDAMPRLTAAQLDAYIDDLLDQPDSEITPPDALVSVLYEWHGQDLDEVRKLAAELPADVVRAKGFIPAEGKMYLFSYVMGTWTLEPTTVAADKIRRPGAVVFIGSIESMSVIEGIVASGSWTGGTVLQPGQEQST